MGVGGLEGEDHGTGYPSERVKHLRLKTGLSGSLSIPTVVNMSKSTSDFLMATSVESSFGFTQSQLHLHLHPFRRDADPLDRGRQVVMLERGNMPELEDVQDNTPFNPIALLSM
jgi:hypothetical protein